MKKSFLWGLLLASLSIVAYAEGTASSTLNVTEVMVREVNTHNIFFSGSVPDQGCTHNDRAVIVDGEPGGEALLSTALTALATQRNVVINVNGCALLNPAGGTLTAPRLIRLSVYSE